MGVPFGRTAGKDCRDCYQQEYRREFAAEPRIRSRRRDAGRCVVTVEFILGHDAARPHRVQLKFNDLVAAGARLVRIGALYPAGM